MSVLHISFGAVAGRSRSRHGGVGRDALPRRTQAWFGADRLVAHPAHEPAHALFVASVARQAQVVAQAQHALKIVLRELRIEQAYEF